MTLPVLPPKQIYEDIYFDSLPPDVGGTLLNLAKCHVRNPKKTADEVEATYQRWVVGRAVWCLVNHRLLYWL